MGFLLKKIISALILPIPMALSSLLVGALLLRRWPRMGKGLMILGPAYLLLLSFSPFSVWLTNSLELRYPVYQGQPVDYVFVLGNAHMSHPDRPPEQQLSAAAKGRLWEGLRIWRQNPDATLVVSGYGGLDPIPHALLARDAAIANGVPAEQIITLPAALDTGEEAMLTAEFAQGKSAALVTSATHMHRALKHYHGAGLAPIPSPADFTAIPSRNWQFSADNLLMSQRTLHEYIGLVWFYFRH